MIDLSAANDNPELSIRLAQEYDFVAKSNLPPVFGGPYVWIRRKRDGRLELAR